MYLRLGVYALGNYV